MPTGFYRYLSSSQEISQVIDERKVQSTNSSTQYATWYCPTRSDSDSMAEQEVALPRPPTHRIGPIPNDQMPQFDIGLRPVSPAFGQPGGGVEARTAAPVWLFGLWDFQGTAWIF